MNFSPVRIVAAVWALVFAALHVLWAAGVPIGPDQVRPGGVADWFLDYDAVVVAGCLIAGAVALWGRRWMLILVGAVPLVVGMIGLVQLAGRVLDGTFQLTSAVWIEPAFVLGGVLFMIAARRPSAPVTASARR